MPNIPPRQRLAPSPFHFYRHPNAPPNTPDAEFEAVRWPSHTWFGETEEEDNEIKIGHFWTDLMDLPAGLISDSWPDAPENLIYDVEEDEWLKVVMVERQRPRPDFDRAYLVRRRLPSQTCLAEVYGHTLPILYRCDINGFGSNDEFPPEFWEDFNRTWYFFAVMHEEHANDRGAFPWAGITATGLTDYYRAPDAMASTMATPFSYMLSLRRKGNRGYTSLSFGINVTPGGPGIFDKDFTTLYLLYRGTLPANSILKYSSAEPLVTTPITLHFESLQGGPGLAAYPPHITVEPISHAPCPSHRFTRDIYFADYPSYPEDTYVHRNTLGTVVYSILQRAFFVLYQTGPARWQGYWSSWLSVTSQFPFVPPHRFDFAVELAFTYPDRWRARVHDNIKSYTEGADTALVAVYDGQVPTANLADTSAPKVLTLTQSTGRVSDPPARFVFR